MELLVLIESVAESGFRARIGEPLALVAYGPTREQALSSLRQMLDQRLATGVELAAISVANGKVRPPSAGGIWNENDPDVQEWLRTIEENRRLDDIAEGIER